MGQDATSYSNNTCPNKNLAWKSPGEGGFCRFDLVDCLTANPPYSRHMAMFFPVVGRFRASKPPWAKMPPRTAITPVQIKTSPGKVRARVGFVASIGWIACRRIHPTAAVWPRQLTAMGQLD
ncbi:MAG: hypothetical protein Q7U98_06535 [Methylicorpusculum sp.]|uniref:hypothetical protein n=1 Tax=Methylicorpusculum sp. TaxID=2713644 RepID=UPI00271A9AA2|nr:hypothetical protein [Methylicorpusculum sp.]MDO8938797.1 hypothetical protein [Methylicorpusculum sp.]